MAPQATKSRAGQSRAPKGSGTYLAVRQSPCSIVGFPFLKFQATIKASSAAACLFNIAHLGGTSLRNPDRPLVKLIPQTPLHLLRLFGWICLTPKASRKAEESRSDHLGEGKCTERARLETTGCILSGAGTPKSEFRVDWLCPRRDKHTMCASQKFKSEIPTKEDSEGHDDSRAFAPC